MPAAQRSTLRKAARAARRLWWAARPRGGEQRFDAVRSRFYRHFWAHAAREAGAELEELGAGFLQVRRGDARTFVQGGSIALDDHVRARMARNKVLTARLLGPLGFATPPSVEFDLESLPLALEFLKSADEPVVIKPDGVPKSRFVAQDGPGAGRGVTCGVRTADELARAARFAILFGERIIAERMVQGASFRLLYLDGVLVDAVRRDPPRVFGDGLSSVAELMRAETAERLAAYPPTSFFPLEPDLDTDIALARQGLSLQSVPRALQEVRAKTVCNQNAAYDNHVVREAVHPELARLGARMVEALGLRLAGVDVMASDIGAPPGEGAFFSEVNANPGLHHHWLVAEPARRAPVGALALEAALRKGRDA